VPVFALTNDLIFPDPSLAEDDGLLAVGGDLSAERLLLAYSHGIFPWYSDGEPILWWSPEPRMIVLPGEFKCSKSLRQTIRTKGFKVKFDQAFEQVINACSMVRRDDQRGTWITEEMKSAYIHLHELGFAHSVETYLDGELVGGLYGVSLGKAFFGESMFHYRRDASKVAFYFLVKRLLEWEFDLIDSQVETSHLKSLCGGLVPRKKFLQLLSSSLKHPTIRGKW
jgi:leucyl/phenylalanyl-tRNA--protein transferase